MKRILFAAVMMLLCALGCTSTTYIEDLQTPALIWTQGSGNCSKIVAVDRSGVVWTNEGCEDGRPVLAEVRTASGAQLDDLWAKFDLLPLGQTETLQSCAGRMLDDFNRADPQSGADASVCGGTQYDDVSSLPSNFQPLAQALVGLE